MPKWWKLSRRAPFWAAVLAMTAIAAAYVLGISAYQSSGQRFVKASDLYIPRLIDVVIAGWCLWVASSVGSFLNVVAWRMPRGESINGRSYCPRCQSQLKARDNFPVFGWLSLGGRCRSCRLPISARYPIVEALVGITIAAVAIGELYRISLPRQATHWHGGPFWAPVVDRELLLILFYHAVAMANLWACGLVRMDSNRIPGRLIGFIALASIVPLIALPTLAVVPWQMLVPVSWVPTDATRLDALLRVITSVVAAIFFARVLARSICPKADPKLDPLGKSTARLLDLIVILAIPFLVVGWHASPALVVVATLISVLIRKQVPVSCDSLGRFAMAVPITLMLQLLLWRRLDQTSWWPSDGSTPWTILVWGAVAMLIAPMFLHDRRATESLGTPELEGVLGADSGPTTVTPIGEVPSEEVPSKEVSSKEVSSEEVSQEPPNEEASTNE